MADAFGVESHTRVTKRTAKSQESGRFSPSFGVHHGLIPDPNWPPAHFPDNSVAMQRKHRRVVCDFMLELAGRRVEVHGDVSKGGVMFLAPSAVTATTGVVEVRGVRAEVTILTSNPRGTEFAHHAQFVDAGLGARVWKALISA
jgi:hypothetical protein